MSQINRNYEVITLGGGCFWCIEAVFTRIKGIKKVESGYSGGKTVNPTYAQISRGTTGHAEVIQVTFDPKESSLTDLLEIFFTIHDPTTLNRQGADVGTQYRSVIFFHTDEQKAIIDSVIDEFSANTLWDRPIITQVEPLNRFYKAEDYHVNYYTRHQKQPYCQLVIVPKLDKFREKFRNKLKT